MNVVIYSRVSSQSARQSTERQVVDLERFAAGRGYEVTAVFEEKISGRKANIERPVLSRCLEYCTDPQNRVDMLLLTEISRLGRSMEILKSLDATLTRIKYACISKKPEPTAGQRSAVTAGQDGKPLVQIRRTSDRDLIILKSPA